MNHEAAAKLGMYFDSRADYSAQVSASSEFARAVLARRAAAAMTEACSRQSIGSISSSASCSERAQHSLSCDNIDRISDDSTNDYDLYEHLSAGSRSRDPEVADDEEVDVVSSIDLSISGRNKPTAATARYMQPAFDGLALSSELPQQQQAIQCPQADAASSSTLEDLQQAGQNSHWALLMIQHINERRNQLSLIDMQLHELTANYMQQLTGSGLATTNGCQSLGAVTQQPTTSHVEQQSMTAAYNCTHQLQQAAAEQRQCQQQASASRQDGDKVSLSSLAPQQIKKLQTQTINLKKSRLLANIANSKQLEERQFPQLNGEAAASGTKLGASREEDFSGKIKRENCDSDDKREVTDKDTCFSCSSSEQAIGDANEEQKAQEQEKSINLCHKQRSHSISSAQSVEIVARRASTIEDQPTNSLSLESAANCGEEDTSTQLLERLQVSPINLQAKASASTKLQLDSETIAQLTKQPQPQLQQLHQLQHVKDTTTNVGKLALHSDLQPQAAHLSATHCYSGDETREPFNSFTYQHSSDQQARLTRLYLQQQQQQQVSGVHPALLSAYQQQVSQHLQPSNASSHVDATSSSSRSSLLTLQANVDQQSTLCGSSLAQQQDYLSLLDASWKETQTLNLQHHRKQQQLCNKRLATEIAVAQYLSRVECGSKRGAAVGKQASHSPNKLATSCSPFLHYSPLDAGTNCSAVSATSGQQQLTSKQQQFIKSHFAAQHKLAFQCHVCHSGFEDRHRLQQHLSIHLQLNKSWYTESTVKETMSQYEMKRGDYFCTRCQRRFDTTAEFDKHMQLHGEKPHRCELCFHENSFRYYRQYLTHYRNHCVIYRCQFVGNCNHQCNRRDYLKSHILKHHLNNKLPADQGVPYC